MANKTYSGFTKETAENLLLDAGAIFVNYNIEEDTYDSAVEAGKLLGATSGGNTFEAIPEFRQVEVDGVKGKAKGLSILEFWEVSLTTNMLEFKEDTYKHSLAGVNVTEKVGLEGSYSEIKAKNFIEEEDYLDNITFVGRVLGKDKPVIIQVYNALNMEGLSIENSDSEDIVAELKFEGHYDAANLDHPPFAIFYPTNSQPLP